MLEWMLRAAIVGGIATAAAWLFERGFRNVNAGTRHAWTFALLATTLLPLIPRLSESSSMSDVVPAITLPTVIVSGGTATSSAMNTVLLVWLMLSASVLLTYGISYARLQRARRTWRLTRLIDDEVFLSEEFGPAIFGFIAPRIVVPEWVRATSHEEQRLIVLHEREHIRAHDHLQLLLTMVATIAMPWNPFVWIQSRRLRFALEADCDQRVLAAIPDHERYATLLVDVGSRQMGLWLTPALAEHRNGLERRIVMLATKIVQNRWKAAAMMVLGIGATVVACESRLPQEPQPMREEVRMSAESPSGMKVLSDADMETGEPTVGELMDRHYPPLLRDAGIGGTVRVRARTHADGRVDGYELVGSSGHQALDEAGMRVLREMDLSPAKSTTGEMQNTLNEFILEFNPNRRALARPTAPEPAEATSLPRKVSQEPSFTPFTDRPTLANRGEVLAALKENYPPALKEAGVGGTALVWVLLDETGKVIRTQIKETSGHAPIDEAVQRVAREMRFTPARNEGKPVAVWIVLPIVMKTE